MVIKTVSPIQLPKVTDCGPPSVQYRFREKGLDQEGTEERLLYSFNISLQEENHRESRPGHPDGFRGYFTRDANRATPFEAPSEKL